MSKLIPALTLFIIIAGPAQAYIGPGAGAGAIAVVLGVLGAIAMAFFAILWYPIKRMMKKRKAAKTARTEAEGPDAS